VRPGRVGLPMEDPRSYIRIPTEDSRQSVSRSALRFVVVAGDSMEACMVGHPVSAFLVNYRAEFG
jgi:hypothetical protein